MTLGRVLPTRAVAKPWGRDRLPATFTDRDGERIGEIWFEPPEELPELLVKYLFTSENLSVQVHPGDTQAPAGEPGKDECWLIVGAEPGARLALGLTHNAGRDAVRRAALDGSIEELLAWHHVAPGDFFYIPAGTIHAIGAGISLIEVQQNSDLTYRLYDYGRPRALHLEEALAVASLRPHGAGLRRRLAARGTERLVDGPHFRLHRVSGPPDAGALAGYGDRPLLVVPLGAAVSFGEGVAKPGECAVVASLGQCRFAPDSEALIAQPLWRP